MDMEIENLACAPARHPGVNRYSFRASWSRLQSILKRICILLIHVPVIFHLELHSVPCCTFLKDMQN